MEILYLGHAGFKVRNEAGNSLILDPWLSTSGAFLRSWFQFPENHFLADTAAAVDPERDCLYISHSHPDHFDRDFLARIDRATPIVTGRYLRRHFARALRALGFLDVRELNTGESLELRGFRLTLFVDESYVNEDSGILIEADGTRFLDMNDCRAYDGIDAEAIQPIDLFTIQFSGASNYPVGYDYPKSLRHRLAAQKNQRKFGIVRSVVEKIRPRLYVPSAGPACFLDPEIFEANFGEPSAFPDATEFLPWLSQVGQETSHLFPGDRIQLRAGRRPEVESGGRYGLDLFENKQDYLADYARRFRPHAALPDVGEDALASLHEVLRAKIEALSRPLQASHRVCVSLTQRPDQPDAHLLLDLSRRTLEQVELPPEEAVYAYRLPNRVACEFFASGALWDELLLSLRFRVHRTPDLFDALVTDFMRLEPSDLRIYPRPQRKGRIEVECDGVRYEIDRYCPHQGGDLGKGLVVDGHLVCPRHGWRFDLAKGGRSLHSATTINAVACPRTRKTEPAKKARTG